MIHFAFSDECGNYIKDRNKGFIRSHPYYIRVTFLIRALEYKELSNRFVAKKREYNLPEDKEIKWSYLWSLRKHEKNDKEIREHKDYYFLRGHDYHDLIDFVEESLALFHDLDFVKIIFTVTDNSHSISFEDLRLLKMHLEELLPRLEMELQHDARNLAVIFVDPINKNKNKLLREAYFEISQDNDLIDEYSHVKDSLNFENSSHSVGIQLADFLAGCTSAFFKCQHRDSYERGNEMFRNNVIPFLRRNNYGSPLGYGIREVPSNSKFREKIKSYL